ncbi:toast rack family protein [Pontibacillus marinus]|uniref:DUF2154 domain-containing protein n=1 Tax=Pontibacillus marinus BH030004 = DSM 16465 TaxID=1385511 RepID=A0A0A5FY75_9BACI|nr:LiaF domain-containing protein [Pontibacillus marinus]KGX84744.1 hypothetical protein N783_16030 [Pontibacillus marinus BH030004 = DSM 16465]
MGNLNNVFKKLVKFKDEFTEEDSSGIWEKFEKDFSVQELNELNVKGDLGAGSLIIKQQNEGVNEIKVICEYRKTMPNIEFNKIGEQGKLKLSQQSHTGTWKNAKQKWTIYLPTDISTTLKLNLGAGSNELDFGKVDLAGLEIQSGVGSCEINLTQQFPKHARIPVKLDSGVGSMDLRLSEDLPAKVKCSKGIGSFSGRNNMVSIGNEQFTTKTFEQDQPYFDFNISLGVGSIDWITE